MPNDAAFTGPQLADLRRSARVSRADVARALGVSISRIRNAELAASVPAGLRERITAVVGDLATARDGR